MHTAPSSASGGSQGPGRIWSRADLRGCRRTCLARLPLLHRQEAEEESRRVEAARQREREVRVREIAQAERAREEAEAQRLEEERRAEEARAILRLRPLPHIL